MHQKTPQHFSLMFVGLALIILSVVPTVIGMVHGFEQLSQGGSSTSSVTDGVNLSFHPAFIVCGNAGLICVIVAIFNSFRRKRGKAGL